MAEQVKYEVGAGIYLDPEGNIVDKDHEDAQKENRTVAVYGTPGDSLGEALELYGEEVVYDLYSSHFAIRIGNTIRPLIKQGWSEEKIVSEMNGWRPDVTRRRSASKESIDDLFSQLSEDEKVAFIERIKEQAGL